MELTMTNQPPVTRSPRSGRHWVFAALTVPLAPLLLGASVLQNHGWHGCVAGQSAQQPCSPSSTWLAIATLGFWTLALASAVTGLVVGIGEGLCAPWALLAYALGYGPGRLLPARRSATMGQPRRGGTNGCWQHAVQLYRALADGQQPPPVYVSDLPASHDRSPVASWSSQPPIVLRMCA